MAIVIRRGSTPEIKCYIPEDIDMSSIVNIWLYLTQNEHGKDVVKIDKLYDDITKTPEEHLLSVTLSQDDTLNLKAGTALIQIRLLMQDGTCLPSSEETVRVLNVYKGGVMTNGEGD